MDTGLRCDLSIVVVCPRTGIDELAIGSGQRQPTWYLLMQRYDDLLQDLGRDVAVIGAGASARHDVRRVRCFLERGRRQPRFDRIAVRAHLRSAPRVPAAPVLCSY
jgi:hypothetical protein